MVKWYSASDFPINFKSLPTNFVPILEPGYKSDPDGNCDNFFLCLRHDDGGQTGFHVFMSYLGRWSDVNTAFTGEREVLVYDEARGNLTIAPWSVTQFIPSETITTVSVH